MGPPLLPTLQKRPLSQSTGSLPVAETFAPRFLPALDVPQRAQTPWQYATPQRMTDMQVPPEVSREAVSTSAPLPLNYVRRVRVKAQQGQSRVLGNWKKQVHDLKMLADAAGRAGNTAGQAQLQHKIGVILDNAEKFDEAIKHYLQALQLCKSIKNAQGECLAYNCLGIDYYKTGQFDEAIKMHSKHLDKADTAGRFVAHSNLGLCYHKMGLNEHASIHHQHAVEYATRLGAKDGQQLAVGNLGVCSFAQGDLSTSRVCLNYHLSMKPQKSKSCTSLYTQITSAQTEGMAHRQLGQVAEQAGRLEEAASHLAKSLELAREIQSKEQEQQVSVMLGVVQGLRSMELQPLGQSSRLLDTTEAQSPAEEPRAESLMDTEPGFS